MTKIVSTQFNINNQALEIYFSGCNQYCKGCHNPELRDFNLGNHYLDCIKQIQNKIQEFDVLIKNIWILGGEPLDNDNGDILYFLNKMPKDKKTWLFTSYDFEKVPDKFKEVFDYIKCGKYEENLRVPENLWHGVNLISSNQKIFKKGSDY